MLCERCGDKPALVGRRTGQQMPYCRQCHMALTGRAFLDGMHILFGAATALSRGNMPSAPAPLPPPQEEDSDANHTPQPPAPPAPPG